MPKMQKPVLGQAKKIKKEEKMNAEDLNLVMQLLESMSLAAEELEKAVEKNNTDRIKRSKQEILSFQKKINDLLK